MIQRQLNMLTIMTMVNVLEVTAPKKVKSIVFIEAEYLETII